ncbi:hypothetical protein P3S67_008127 [Capsicum chacoense]
MSSPTKVVVSSVVQTLNSQPHTVIFKGRRDNTKQDVTISWSSYRTCSFGQELNVDIKWSNRGGPKNYRNMYPVESEFRQYIRKSSRERRPSPTGIERGVNKELVDWFHKRIMNPDTIDTMSIDLKILARGPCTNSRRFTAYNINGSKFQTLAREEGLKTQNSGVFLTTKTSCVASSIDGNFRLAELPYFGNLEYIIEINYNGHFKVVLFKWKWVDTTRDRGYQKDRWNLNCVNFDILIHTGEREEHEPYIEASQSQMVYYVDDIINK